MTSPTFVRSLNVLTWGERTIPYELLVENRKDLSITVHPDLRVTVRAPHSKAPSVIQSRLQAKRSWIARQLRDFEQYHPLPEARRFVSGETHWYLGRQYRLRVVKGPPSLRCLAGRITVSVSQPERAVSVKSELDAWYRLRAHAVFAERLNEIQRTARKLRGLDPKLRVRKMEKRWGSCSPRGTITLNTELIRAPKACIDYVIVHELCHLLVPSHSRRFFQAMETCLPDWEKRRARLNQVRG